MEPQSAPGRTRLLEAAIELFLQTGYDGTGMQTIADHAGVSKALLHYHFDSKLDLLAAIVEPFFDDADDALDQLQAHTPAETDKTLATYLDLILRHRDVTRLLTTDITTRDKTDYSHRYDHTHQRFRTLLSDDEPFAAAALGVLARPVVQLKNEPTHNLETRRDQFIAAAKAVLETKAE